MLLDLLNIMTNDATIEEMEGQITRNSMNLRLKQKISAQKISDIHNKFKEEKDKIRNEISNLDKTAINNEYQDLMAELNELKDEEEQAVEREEQEAKDYEERVQLENDGLETRLEALRADTQSLKEFSQDSIKDSFGYFE